MKMRQHLMSFAILPLFLLGNTCAKDSEENNDEDSDFIGVHYSKDEDVSQEMAVENWETFLKISQEYIDTAETNIGTLEIKADEADSDSKTELRETCDANNLALIRLKAKRAKRNKEFEKEVRQYNRAVYDKNEAFERVFQTEMTQITVALEKTLEKSRSGYYKSN